MAQNNEQDMVFEDISSATKKPTVSITEEYAGKALSNIDKVLKTISFIVAIGVFIAFAAIAAVLAYLDSVFILVSVGILVVGTILSLILLFVIYGMGQIISQNNEIIKRIK